MSRGGRNDRARFIVGIDLGTTHTVVAYADTSGEPSIFEIPQLVSPTEVASRPLLPSLLYVPAPGESFADPWNEAPFVLGELARVRGVAVPGRLVASAKSWLSHLGVDRNAPILPWGIEEQPALSRISPVEANAMYLGHVRKTWDQAFSEHPLSSQDVILTVPASFDESARKLTLEAADRAGLEVRLLEEPQAAFYDYLHRGDPDALVAMLRAKKRDPMVLVCDVGGGTTDLSLMRIRDAVDAPFRVSRISVGRHLLLGGDNMDLALAHLCEPRLGSEKMDSARFGQLVLSCRSAKERLLAKDAPPDYPVTVLSAGSALVGSARSARLGRGEVEELVVQGFFPEVALETRAEIARGALVGFGLPYERDVAITRHVASFLRRQAPEARTPDALLLNGGVFRAAVLGERLRTTIESWSGTTLEVLPHVDPDLAVARGAVAYGQSLRGRGLHIEANSPRGYYIGLDARPGERRRLVSVVPRGAREGDVHRLKGRTFGLLVGRPARFDLFASDQARIDAPGEVVSLEDDKFMALPPVAVRFEASEQHRTPELEVELEGELTPIGTLELACVEVGAPSSAKHRLAFELRKGPAGDVRSEATGGGEVRPSGLPSAAPSQRRMLDATQAIENVFGRGRQDVAARAVKDLVRDLEKILGDRPSWTTEVARTLYDEITKNPASRRRSADHERVFFLLAGYTIRPGFGDPRDPARVELLAPLFSQMLAFPAEARSWQQFFIAFRRAAGGLLESWQTAIRDEIDPYLAPAEKRLKRRKGLHPQAPYGMLEMASSLERVAPARRAELGSWILERTWTDRDHRLFAAIGRLGARVPAYASVHHVIRPALVERWLDHLLREKWDELPAAAEAAVRCARLTGDRARDVGDAVRREVEKKLVRAGAKEEWVRAVREVVAVKEADRAVFFGESLPVGLRLLD